jgi:hypothetical protein
VKKYLTVEEAAERLGVSKSWLYSRWAEERSGGAKGPPRSKKAGRTFISIELLDAWVFADASAGTDG